jgi:hypothetical protein
MREGEYFRGGRNCMFQKRELTLSIPPHFSTHCFQGKRVLLSKKNQHAEE